MKPVKTVQNETLVRSIHAPGVGLPKSSKAVIKDRQPYGPALTGPKKSRPGIGIPEHESPCQTVSPDSRFFCYYDGKGQEITANSYYAALNIAALLFKCTRDAVTVVGPFVPVVKP